MKVEVVEGGVHWGVEEECLLSRGVTKKKRVEGKEDQNCVRVAQRRVR